MLRRRSRTCVHACLLSLAGAFHAVHSFAFVPSDPQMLTGRPHIHSSTHQPSLSAVAASPPLPSEGAPSATNKNVTYSLEIDFDAEGGSLQITRDADGRKICLLRGLSAASWSAAAPASNASAHVDVSQGAFLHSRRSSEASAFDTSLGKLATFRRFLACARLTRYWMGPAFGRAAVDVPLDTQFLLLEVEEDGPYALLLPLLDGDFRASLSGNAGGELVCHQESGDDAVRTSGATRALYVAVGDDPYRLLKEGFAAVAKETGTFATLDDKRLPASVDDFGWCTWDAFYSEVTPQGVIDGVASLREAGIQPRTVILDDGWQQVEPQKKGPAADDVMEPRSQQSSSIVSKVMNGMLGMLSKVLSLLYEKFVRRAPHKSLPNKIWRYLTRTVLKGQLWEYFDNDTDFGRQLSGFQPNEKFQKKVDDEDSMDLKELVTRLKTEMGVARLFCWHALHGYWRGVAPELGKEHGFHAIHVVPELSEHLLNVEPILAWDSVSLFGVGLVLDEREVAKFYNELHAPLVDAGVDGVKVDVQSGVSSLGGGTGGASRIARAYTRALEKSVSARFADDDSGGIACLNCMCHSTENLYHYEVTSVARASDDFYPRRPESHTVHLVNVAYNSLFIGEICLPDWDMFHSRNEAGPLHAAARAVSGGPVYVSDAPGQHDAELLRRLVLEDGTVLRCLRPGRPTRDCLFADVGKDNASILKVWNENRYGGVVGLFNSQGVAWNFNTHENEVVCKSPPTLTASIKPYDVESLRNMGESFVAYRHRTCSLDYLEDGESKLEIKLAPREWDILTIVPVHGCESENGISWSPIGLADMLNSGGAVSEVTGITDTDSLRASSATFSSRGPGQFVAYCRPEPSHVSLFDEPSTRPMNSLPFTYDSRSGLLSFTLPSERGGPHRVKVSWE